MSVAAVLLWIVAPFPEPDGHLDVHAKELWIGLIYIGAFAGPIATWAAVSVNRALPPIVGRWPCSASPSSASPPRSS